MEIMQKHHNVDELSLETLKQITTLIIALDQEGLSPEEEDAIVADIRTLIRCEITSVESEDQSDEMVVDDMDNDEFDNEQDDEEAEDELNEAA